MGSVPIPCCGIVGRGHRGPPVHAPLSARIVLLDQNGFEETWHLVHTGSRSRTWQLQQSE